MLPHTASAASPFLVYPDSDGSVRTDHYVRWWGLSVLHLHYHITRAQPSAGTGRALENVAEQR